MIFFAELQVMGDKHVDINTSVLNILLSEYNNSNITIFCDNFHLKNLERGLGMTFENSETFPFKGHIEEKKSKIPFKVFRELKLAFQIFKEASNQRVEFIFFASSYPFTQIFLNFFSYFFHQKIILAQHGDLGVLTLKNKKITTLVFGGVQKIFFKYRSKNVIVLFYGKSIKDYFFTLFASFSKRNIITIDHPYNYIYQKSVSTELDKNSTLNIAIIGTGLMNKNSHYVYSVANNLQDCILNGELSLYQIGNVSKEVLQHSNDLVQTVGNGVFMGKDTFEEYISKSDYFLYFFTKSSYYDLCPSGTFFDALKYNKPIIALDNYFFRYYFSKFGMLGKLFDDIDEMSEFIKRLSTDTVFEKEFKENCLKNILIAKNELSISKISRSFFDQFNQLKNG